MYSIGILSIILFGLVTLTNAFQCRPLPCMIHCRYGFDVDTQGCPICKCRQSPPDVCVQPIPSYNCGLVEHQDCPSSHECQFDSIGYSGQCCLKQTSSTNRLAVAATPTTRVTSTTSKTRPTTTTKPHTTTKRPTTTRHLLNGMFTATTGAAKSSTATQRWFRSLLF